MRLPTPSCRHLVSRQVVVLRGELLQGGGFMPADVMLGIHVLAEQVCYGNRIVYRSLRLHIDMCTDYRTVDGVQTFSFLLLCTSQSARPTEAESTGTMIVLKLNTSPPFQRRIATYSIFILEETAEPLEVQYSQ